MKLLPQLIPLIPAVIQLAQQLIPLIPPLIQIAAIILEKVIPALEPLIALALRLATDVLLRLIDGIKNTIGAAKQFGKDVAAAFGTAKDTVLGDWNKVVSFVGGLPAKLATAGVHMWDWIYDTFRSAINTVLGWWNSLKFTTPHVHIPGIGDTPSVTIGVPQIPYLAAGGDIAGAGLAVVGEQGPELVQLGAPARVVSNSASRQLLGAGGTPPDHFTAEITLRGIDGQYLDKVLVKFQRQGGTLQSVHTGALAAIGATGR